MDHTQYKGFILGATGAIGRELVRELLESPNWSEVTVIVRRKLEEWDSFKDSEKQKLKIIQEENLDSLSDPSKWNLAGYSSVFCCLGSRVGRGKELFRQIDYTYPLEGAKLALSLKIPHYSLLSSIGASSSSWSLYTKTKGQVEDDLKKLNLPHASIFRPGVLLNRRNDDRFGEKLAGIIPFVPKIEVRDVARALRVEAELQAKTPYSQNNVLYDNSQIKTIAAKEKYPENIKC